MERDDARGTAAKDRGGADARARGGSAGAGTGYAPADGGRVARLADALTRAVSRARVLVQAQAGWRRHALSAGLGVALALSMAPLFFWPLIFLAFPAALWQLDALAPGHGEGAEAGAWGDARAGGRTLRRAVGRAALLGLTFGIGFFLVGFHWMGHAFLVDAATHGWMLPFVLVLMPTGFGLFTAAVYAGTMALWRPGSARILVFALLWSLAEWLRGHVLTGFPWNTVGYAWADGGGLMQATAHFGVYGLSLLTVLAAASLARLGDPVSAAEARAAPRSLIRPPRRHLLAPAALCGLLLFFAAEGTLRLTAAPAPGTDDTGTTVRLVQPSIPQADKWKPELRASHWRRLMELTSAEGIGAVDVVVWPEAAPPFALARTPEALRQIGAALPDAAYLITGATRFEANEGPEAADDPWTAYNALFVVDGRGEIRAVYDKFHLVPFGEYLPFEEILEPIGFTQLVQAGGDFRAGPGPRTLTLPGVGAVAPLICYEAIFPGSVVDRRARPEWIANVTDDAWFGTWAGPHQHYAQARLRAVEEGLPVVRVANNGISAVVDGFGRERAFLPLDSVAFADTPLPESLPPTFYARYGDTTYFFIVILVAIVALAGIRARRYF